MSTEDNLARIIQYTQDGWEKPLPRNKEEGQIDRAAKNALLAFDFSKAYDKVWKKGLLYKLIKMEIPTKMIKWIRSFITERHACVEVNGKTSKWKKFKEGLPQGSVIAPLLFILFLADLNEDFGKLDRTDANFFADDTSVNVSGTTIEETQRRAQDAADVFKNWARKWKMAIAAEKTQMLVLSLNASDSNQVEIKMNGTVITSSDSLKILGVTLDRRLQFGKHAKQVKGKVMRRCKQLAQVANRSWGTNYQTKKIMTKSYVDGPALYAAGAWGPAAGKTHIQSIDRARKVAARVQTGCLRSTPNDALFSEAEMLPLDKQIEIRATKMYEKSMRLGVDNPLGALTAIGPQQKSRNLKTVNGWRKVGEATSRAAGLSSVNRELINNRTKVNVSDECMSFNMNIDVHKSDPAEEKKRTTEKFIEENVPRGICIWSDGSAIAGTENGGGGALIVDQEGNSRRISCAAGKICSSTRAELMAIHLGLEDVVNVEGLSNSDATVNVLLDSKAAIQTLKRGPQEQNSNLGTSIWEKAEKIGKVNLFWVPSHCGIEGNEVADGLAKHGTTMTQEDCEVTLETSMTFLKRKVETQFLEDKRKTDSRRETDVHWRIVGDKWPKRLHLESVQEEGVVRQLRTGHCSLLRQYAHRIGIRRVAGCNGCERPECEGARCRRCGQYPETANHFIFDCEWWMNRPEPPMEARLSKCSRELLGHRPGTHAAGSSSEAPAM